MNDPFVLPLRVPLLADVTRSVEAYTLFVSGGDKGTPGRKRTRVCFTQVSAKYSTLTPEGPIRIGVVSAR